MRADRDVRSVVLTGAGDGFCSGADLSSISADLELGTVLESMRELGEICRTLAELPKPTIAAVNGVAAGGGCSLALACDLVVASDRARFALLFGRRGLSIDMSGSWTLPRLVGMHRAKELALLGDIIDAAEAERIGLVNRVVPAAELDATVADLATRIERVAPIATSLTKELLNRSLSRTLAEALDAESVAQTINTATNDAREAFAAFLEKRDPNFTGG